MIASSVLCSVLSDCEERAFDTDVVAGSVRCRGVLCGAGGGFGRRRRRRTVACQNRRRARRSLAPSGVGSVSVGTRQHCNREARGFLNQKRRSSILPISSLQSGTKKPRFPAAALTRPDLAVADLDPSAPCPSVSPLALSPFVSVASAAAAFDRATVSRGVSRRSRRFCSPVSPQVAARRERGRERLRRATLDGASCLSLGGLVHSQR